MSQLFVRTLREDPADAEVPSHRWLVRAGYIRRAAPGIYSWLPLGLKVLAKVEQIVREEMVAIMVKDLYGSYKDLPLTLFQIQTKYRDEARPRAGLLRGREFIMKDSYTFDMDAEGLQRSYEIHRGAYVKVMDRLGLDYVIVEAMSGAMGGSASEEFLAIAPNGEDTFVRSPGGYAANVEAVTVVPPAVVDASETPAPLVIHTPGAGTIDTLVTAVNETAPRTDRPWTGADTLKNVVFMLQKPDGTREPLIIGLPGNRDVDLKRLSRRD